MQAKLIWLLLPLALLACDLLPKSSSSSEDDDGAKASEDDDGESKKKKKKKKKKKGDDDDDTEPAASKPTCDGKAAVESAAKGMLDAVASGDTDRVKGKLLDLAMTPEDAGKLFGAVYGGDLGAKVAKGWEEEVFAELPKLVRPFKRAGEEGQTEITVQCITSADDAEATGLQKDAIKAMKTKTALYTVKFVKPGEYTVTLVYGKTKVTHKLQVEIAPGIETR